MAISKINTPEIFDLGATNTSLKLPSGGTSSRPSNPSTGQWRYNTDLKYVEYYDGNDWQQIDIEEECTTNTVNFPSGMTVSAYYKLDYSARDESSNNNDGTEYNITYVNGSPYSQAAVFNGTNSYIEASNSVQQPTTNFSVSIWTKLNSLSGGGSSGSIGFVGNMKSGVSPQVGFAIVKLSTEDSFSFWADGTANSTGGKVLGTTVIQTGVWYHVVGTYDGASVKIYVNGTLENSVSYSSTPGTPAAPLVIGRWYGNFSDYYLDGQIDQTRIFTTALSPSQVTELYNEVQCPCTTNTIGYSVDAIGSTTNTSTEAYYKLDGNAYDSTANANNGTWGGTESYSVSPYGVAAVFDGSSSRINTGLIWPGGTQLSWSGWINTAGGINQYLFADFNSAGADASMRFAVQFHTTNVLFVGTNNSTGGTGTFINFGSISSYLNKWTHVAITVNGTAVKAYLDGSLFGTSTGTALAQGSNPFTIGALHDGAGYQNVNGSIDQVRLFSSALTSDQVSELYNEVYCNTISTLDVFGDSSGVALYQFNGNANSTDSSTYNGTWTGTEAYTDGYFDSAADFDGSSSKINAPAILSSSYTGSVSFSAWFNTSNSSSNIHAIIVSDGTTPVSGKTILVSVSNGVLELVGYNFATFLASGSTNVADGAWHNIVLVLDNSAGTFKLYLDGNSTPEITHTNSLGANLTLDKVFSTNWNIGAQDNIRYFDGSIDQVRIFKKALTAFEVLQLYSE